MLLFRRLFLLLLLAAPAAPAAAFSVLTHQAVIDTTWDDCLLPLLKARYPGATEKEWNLAKSYAYGGAILQDMGYYPLGTAFFTNLTHYVRSGAFVRALLYQAHDRNEYAFALGSLAHYVADNIGHPGAVNQVVPEVYPDIKAEYGPVVTYEDEPVRHSEVEFAFDVVQIANGRYRTQKYHKSIGFRVSKPVLERAFQQVYGLELKRIFFRIDLSVVMFRFTVNHVLPAVARAAWYNQRREISKLGPRTKRRHHLYRTNRAEFERIYGTAYERPGLGARMMARVIGLLPKIGALRTYAFTLPDSTGGRQFHQTYRAAITRYQALARQQDTDTTALPAALPDTNLDTGRPVHPQDYALTDETYAKWLRQLHDHDFKLLNDRMKRNLLEFYAAAPPPTAPPKHHTKATEDADEDNRKNRKARRKTAEALAELRQKAVSQ